MSPRLWDFPGGLRLPGHKAESMQQPVADLPLPNKIVLPLQQHIGITADPIVEVGEHVLKGQMIARLGDHISAPIHASTSGTVTTIDEQAVPHPSGMPSACITIEVDGEDRAIEAAGVGDYLNTAPQQLREIIRDAGIVGLGGAGFPTYIKLNTGPAKIIDTLILNGAECEPYITCDAMLMQEQAQQLLLGADILCRALQAKRCIIGIEDNKGDAIACLQNTLAENTYHHSIDVVTVPTRYPGGGEKQLIRTLTGHAIGTQQRPTDVGIVCHNVGTAVAVAEAVVDAKPLIERIVTLSGDAVMAPRNWRVRFGTPIQHLLRQHEFRSPDYDLIMGGPMMGFAIHDIHAPIIKTSNCLLVQKRQPMQSARPCIRCGECARVCPAQLLPQQLYWYARAQDFDKVQDYNLFDCIECGCCAYVCPSHIPLVQYYRFAKTEIWNKEREKQKSDRARERHEFHQLRIERKKQEDEERRRKKKEMLNRAKGKTESETDAKKAAIEAALARVKAKKESMNIEPKNIDNLTPEQQQQIEAAEQRRVRLRQEEQDSSS